MLYERLRKLFEELQSSVSLDRQQCIIDTFDMLGYGVLYSEDNHMILVDKMSGRVFFKSNRKSPYKENCTVLVIFSDNQLSVIKNDWWQTEMGLDWIDESDKVMVVTAFCLMEQYARFF